MLWNDEEKRGAVVGFLIQRFKRTIFSVTRIKEEDSNSLEDRAKEFEELRHAASLAELPAFFAIFSEYEQAIRSRIAYEDKALARRVGERELIHLRRKELTIKGQKEDLNQLSLFDLYDEMKEQEEEVLQRIRSIKGLDILEELLKVQESCEKEIQDEAAYYRLMWQRLDELQAKLFEKDRTEGIVELRLLKKAVQRSLEEASED